MESLKDILRGRKFAPPDEIGRVKRYVMNKYQSPCTIKLQKQNIIILVPSAALAATIYLERQELIKACGLGNKRLSVRAGK